MDCVVWVKCVGILLKLNVIIIVLSIMKTIKPFKSLLQCGKSFSFNGIVQSKFPKSFAHHTRASLNQLARNNNALELNKINITLAFNVLHITIDVVIIWFVNKLDKRHFCTVVSEHWFQKSYQREREREREEAWAYFYAFGKTKRRFKKNTLPTSETLDTRKQTTYCTLCARANVYNLCTYFLELFFPGPQAFCKKAVERVRSENNILNSSVEWFFLEKAICMYIIRSGSMSWLTWCTLFLIWTHISRVIDENVRKIAKNGDLKMRIYGSKNISSFRA